MDIKGLDYNTRREPLRMPEYGRGIQQMVDNVLEIADREKRLEAAKIIIGLMEHRMRGTIDKRNLKQTLWDHLYIISGKKLDIDWPYDVSNAEKFLAKPKPLPLPNKGERLPLRHYGRMVAQLAEKLKTMPDGKKREELIRVVANQMKRNLVNWGHGSMDNSRVASELEKLTDGAVHLDLKAFKFQRVKPQAKQEPTKRKKKR